MREKVPRGPSKSKKLIANWQLVGTILLQKCSVNQTFLKLR